MAVYIGKKFAKKYKWFLKSPLDYQRNAVGQIQDTLQAIEEDPFAHDGHQPGTLPNQVRRIIGQRIRVLYRLPDDSGDIYVDDLFEVPML